MKAIILAAGKGTRLRPLTYGIPKTLLPIKGKPMIDWIISELKDSIDEIIVAVSGTSGDNLEERTLSHIHGICVDFYLKNTKSNVDVRTIPTPQRETGGDLKYIFNQFNIHDETVLVVYGDILTKFDINEMVKYHKKCKEKFGTVCTVLVFEPGKDVSRFGVAKLRERDGAFLIDQFVEKPEEVFSTYVSAGYYIVEASEIFKMLPDTSSKIEHSIFPELAEKGKLAAFVTKLPYWKDIGTLDAYREANRLAHEGMLGDN